MILIVGLRNKLRGLIFTAKTQHALFLWRLSAAEVGSSMKNDSPRVASAPLSHRDDLAVKAAEVLRSEPF
jgi:hypothetical protein